MLKSFSICVCSPEAPLHEKTLPQGQGDDASQSAISIVNVKGGSNTQLAFTGSVMFKVTVMVSFPPISGIVRLVTSALTSSNK